MKMTVSWKIIAILSLAVMSKVIQLTRFGYLEG